MGFTTEVTRIRPEHHATAVLGILLPKLSATEGLPPSLQALDSATGGILGRLVASGDLTGAADEVTVAWPAPGVGPERLMVVGLGPAADLTRTAIRRGAAVFAKRLRSVGVTSAALYLPKESMGKALDRDAAQALAEGAHQGIWKYEAMQRPPEDKKPVPDAISLVHEAPSPEWMAGAAAGEAIGAGHTLARTLQMLPGNVCTPSYLARTAEELGQRHGMMVTVLGEEELEREGMRALLAVGQGSAEETRFITLEYKGSEGAPVVLIGKGMSFDTGGISLKPPQNMEDMKYDMSGAAAVLGTFEMLGRLQPKVRVIGLVPTAENMPGSRAVKPGDVITSHLGKTIEVINTDAEGRMILADTLSWARRYEPACVLDAATLTGAVVIALGHEAAGVMGTDEDLIASVRGAGDRAGERVWPLPLWDSYRDQIKSDIADIKNSGGRPAGTITAGWFLREFVDGFPWAHLDIAGTAYTDKESATGARGPTGMGVRLFAEFLLARSA